MIQIDGSQGEGGGQILRTALALSLCTGESFRMTRIRAGRKKPGLLRQHLTAVKAAEQVGNATVSGAELGSGELTFKPEVVLPGNYQFAVGTAGSATLVLQTVLPALLTAGAASKLICQGGTHNPFAPPFDFLDRCFAPQLRKMGADLELKLETPGFYPAGGGVFSAKILPTVKLKPLSLLEHGAIKSRRVHIYLANLPEEIAKREAALLVKYFAPDEILPPYLDFPNSPGPGNVILLEKIHEHVTEIVTSFGEKGVPVETVVRHALEAYNAHQASGAVVGEYLADQLMIPLALAGSGEFICGHPSKHARTNGETIEQFLDVGIDFRKETETTWRCVIE
jgi:RNA 3'-terminal phosphate cyclase (ATP)